MIGDISFYRMRGSLSAGEYPLFSRNQDLSSYLVETVQRVKYRGGLQVSVELPYFSGLESANVANIDDDWYWVTDYRQKTAESNQYILTLDFMGPTSLCRLNDATTGSWHKTPSNLCPYLKNSVANSHMRASRAIATAMDLPKASANYSYYWIQISGYQQNNEIKKYGAFVSFSVYYGADAAGEHATSTIRYPSLAMLLQSLSTYAPGLTASTVLDFSVSKRCPYDYLVDSDGIRILSPGGSPITPSAGSDPSIKMYELDTYILEDQQKSVTITLSAMERAIGEITLRDWNGNDLVQMNNGDNPITVLITTHSDISGIYTTFKWGDSFISIPEGKLPYLENNYDTYRAYQMDTDRMMMSNTIENARFSAITDREVAKMNGAINAAQGLAMGMMTGSIMSSAVGTVAGMASYAVGGYAAGRALQLTAMQARQNNELSMKQAISRPQSSYNVAYGLIYCYLNEFNGLQILVNMPNNIDANYYDAWVQEYGYPAEGVMTISIGTGFYQGKLIGNVGGMRFDRCNETFMNGFKFVSP